MRKLSHDYFSPLTVRENFRVLPFREVVFSSLGKISKITDFFPCTESREISRLFPCEGKGNSSRFSLYFLPTFPSSIQ